MPCYWVGPWGRCMLLRQMFVYTNDRGRLANAHSLPIRKVPSLVESSIVCKLHSFRNTWIRSICHLSFVYSVICRDHFALWYVGWASFILIACNTKLIFFSNICISKWYGHFNGIKEYKVYNCSLLIHIKFTVVNSTGVILPWSFYKVKQRY